MPISIVRKGGKYVVGNATFNTYLAASNYLRKLNGD